MWPLAQRLTHHFVTIYYIYPHYWTIRNSQDGKPPATSMRENVANALANACLSKGLTPPRLPPNLQIPPITIQEDHPLPAWLCGTYTMLAVLHLILGVKDLASIPLWSHH
jgi:hypothetical protein